MLPLIQTLERRTLLAAVSVQIDFTPSSTPAPSGYIADNGLAYGNRNGYTYGWNVSHSTDAFDRSPGSKYPVHSTAIYMKGSTGTRYTWDMAVANGTYNVTVDAGDPSANVSLLIKAESTTVVSGTTTSSARYISTTKTVSVTDGKLTLSSASTTSRDPIMSVKIVTAGNTPSSSGGDGSSTPSTGQVTGQKLQAHGGDIVYFNGLYYWYGENKDAKTYLQSTIHEPRVDVIGISVYTSTDLHTWTYEGLALKGTSTGDLAPGNVLERPKVLYNASTKQYVMWMHIDNATYSMARVGVAVSSSPTGPFTYRGSFRPLGLASRDETVFEDTDGSAYLVFATDNNNSLRIAKMTSDYLFLTGQNVKPISSTKREAPELFKANGYYYLVTSGATWFTPNAAQYAVSTSVLGSYTVMGNPTSSSNMYGYQGAFAFQSQASGNWYLLADKWNTSSLGASTYGFMQITFSGRNLKISAPMSWGLSVK